MKKALQFLWNGEPVEVIVTVTMTLFFMTVIGACLWALIKEMWCNED